MPLSDPKVPSLDIDKWHWWIIRHNPISAVQPVSPQTSSHSQDQRPGATFPASKLSGCTLTENTNLDFGRVHPVMSHNAADRHVTRQNDHIIADVPAGQLALLSCGKQMGEISSSLQTLKKDVLDFIIHFRSILMFWWYTFKLEMSFLNSDGVTGWTQLNSASYIQIPTWKAAQLWMIRTKKETMFRGRVRTYAVALLAADADAGMQVLR